MSFYNNTINKITSYVIDNTSEKTDDEIEILKYGIEVLFMNVSKLMLIYLLAFILGYLLETIFVTIIFGFIRSFASGLHVKGFFKCLGFSMTIFVFIIAASSMFDLSMIFKVIISIALVIGIYMYSPADTEEKPYFDAKNRKTLRRNALIVSVFYMLIWISSSLGIYSNYFVSSLLMQFVLIHPLTYRVFGRRYNNYLYEDDYI